MGLHCTLSLLMCSAQGPRNLAPLLERAMAPRRSPRRFELGLGRNSWAGFYLCWHILSGGVRVMETRLDEDCDLVLI